jgi:hypothetical protein
MIMVPSSHPVVMNDRYAPCFPKQSTWKIKKSNAKNRCNLNQKNAAPIFAQKYWSSRCEMVMMIILMGRTGGQERRSKDEKQRPAGTAGL